MNWLQDQIEQWGKIAEATRVTLVPESNLDTSDPESLMYDGSEDEKVDHFEELAKILKPETTMAKVKEYNL